ncbi:pseudouridine synthase [Lysobacter soyae]|uniref:Pseudouridine synthase n=1 Tax=Lysobacter soyae TaxID=2764185 RepID=A0ABX8WSJ9_9GAMM|nr:pseudouridine synthase [Lysobacter sp. CJ11]QYR53807.1 pseudouridine synthase [Lysobacter sp. CJ11]
MPPSRLQLPVGPWATLIEGLCARFPRISEETWRSRFARGLVTDANGNNLTPETPYRVGLEVRYFREVASEPVIPFTESIVYQDAHLVVAYKPHFLPVMPSGRFVRETLLTRLIERLGNPDLVPLHRIDRETAGLVMFSANPDTRAAYQALFRERRIEKTYEAIAPPLKGREFPFVHRTRIVPGEPFFRMQEVLGEPNSETVIDVIERGENLWLYKLMPVTGRKHQLRVQMAGLGVGIMGDSIYPDVRESSDGDYSNPLQLVARQLKFRDPETGVLRRL